MTPFNKNFILTNELLNVIKARDNFLVELKSIENSVVDKSRKTVRKTAIEFYRQNQLLKFFYRSSFSKISERDFARAAELLSLRTMNITRLRRIFICLNIIIQSLLI